MGHRSHDPSTPDLETDILQNSRHRFGRKLVCDRPMRRPGVLTQLFLQFHIIDLVHDSIGLIGEASPLGMDFPVVIPATIDSGHHPRSITYSEPPVPQAFKDVALQYHVRPRFHGTQGIAVNVQLPLRGDPRILLPQASRRRIARIDEPSVARRRPLRCQSLLCLFVEPVKSLPGYVHLAPHFQKVGGIFVK